MVSRRTWGERTTSRPWCLEGFEGFSSPKRTKKPLREALSEPLRMAKITDELRQRLRRRIDEELPPIIKRSFAHHDKARMRRMRRAFR